MVDLASIGTILFRDLLGMTLYPGSPFTGNIVNDLILFLLIPSIFIIVFVFILLNRLFHGEQAKLRLLVGVGLYLFIIAYGLYPMFAYLAGPYFIFLIFILGILFFFQGHFRFGGGPPSGGGSEQKAYKSAESHLPSKIRRALNVPVLDPFNRAILHKELQKVEDRIKKMEGYIAKGGGKADNALIEINTLRKEEQAIREKLFGSPR